MKPSVSDLAATPQVAFANTDPLRALARALGIAAAREWIRSLCGAEPIAQIGDARSPESQSI